MIIYLYLDMAVTCGQGKSLIPLPHPEVKTNTLSMTLLSESSVIKFYKHP